ncbi:MAG: Gfo/Idh/MocA family oxidoreductase [Armatimonadetes bacterium]|nr:Gfo/Idh/MocA family oxidoreductase [Armatimonadota bacterium]
MEPLRYGFVGAGTIMNFHAERLSQRGDVVLAAVADVAEATLNRAADRFDIPGRYTDYRTMIEKEDLNVLVVCVPNAYHAEATLAGLRAGCHVLCEKPPALNAAQAEEMAAAAAQRNLRLMYGLNMRFMGEVETARRYLESGRFGNVYHGTVQMWRRRGIPGLGSWFTTKAVSGGGALIDVGVHILDLTHYLMGQPKPVAVSAVTHARFGINPETYNYLSMWGTPVPGGPFDVDDLAAAFIRFENGASLVIQVSWAANTSDGSEIRVLGDKGGAEISLGGGVRILTEDNGFISDITPQYRPQDAYAAQHAHFIECIRDPEKPLRTCGRQGVVLQHMLDAIYRSAATGAETRIEIAD